MKKKKELRFYSKYNGKPLEGVKQKSETALEIKWKVAEKESGVEAKYE